MMHHSMTASTKEQYASLNDRWPALTVYGNITHDTKHITSEPVSWLVLR